MHPRRFDILAALLAPGQELRIGRTERGTYAAEIGRAGGGKGRRVAARHAIGVIAAEDVEPVGETGPGRVGVYRLSPRAEDKADAREREFEIITTCALRFDGYRYIDEKHIGTRREFEDETSELDLRVETGQFFTHPDYDASPDYLRMILFLVQRSFMREGRLRWESQLGRVTRQLFIRTCRGDVPAYLRNDEWAEKWDRDFARYAKDLVRFVERRDRATVYDEQLF